MILASGFFSIKTYMHWKFTVPVNRFSEMGYLKLNLLVKTKVRFTTNCEKAEAFFPKNEHGQFFF